MPDEKCKEIRDYIERRILDPNGVPYEAADCVNGIFRDFLAILDRKTPLEQAAKKAARTGEHQDLKKYLKIRQNNS